MIKFDPELVKNIRIIYGDADLDNKTLLLLYNTWQTNPEIIINTARLKLETTKPIILDSLNIIPKVAKTLKEVGADDFALDDLSNINTFGAAFKEARKRGLKVFKWKKTKTNPSGLYTTNLDKYGKQNRLRVKKEITNSFPKNTPSTKEIQLKNLLDNLIYENYKMVKKDNPIKYKERSWNPNFVGYRVRTTPVELALRSLQQGGTMNNQEEMQKAFMAYLIEDAAALGVKIESEEQLRAYAEQLGQEGLKAKYQEFIKKMQGGRMARLGAKLEYYNYLKKGGKTYCELQGGNIPNTIVKKLNAVQKFKSDRKRLDPEKTPTLPGGKYPSYWTPEERIKWERKYGDGQDGAVATKPLGKTR